MAALIELGVARSPSKLFPQTRLRAAAFAGYEAQERGGFTLAVELDRLSRFELSELVAIISDAWSWRGTSASVNRRPLPVFDLYCTLRCYSARSAAKPRDQARYCLGQRDRLVVRTIPEEYRPPCRQLAHAEPVRWADFAPAGLTDHASMTAAMREVAAAHPSSWCPAFEVEHVLVQIRKLPSSRDRTRRREGKKQEQVSAAMAARFSRLSTALLEARKLEADAVHIELLAERIDSRGLDALTPHEWALLADITGLRDLRDGLSVADLTDTQRAHLIDRLRELRASIDTEP